LDIKVFDIIDARCNHEDSTFCLQSVLTWSVWFSEELLFLLIALT